MDEKRSKRGGKTKFKPGHNTPGPGRPKVPEEIKEARKFSAHEVEILFTKFIQMNREQLAAVKLNPEATLLELALHSIFTYAINKGDQIRLDFVLNRLIGKSPDLLKLSGGIHVGYAKQSPSQTAASLKKLNEEF